jgi:hypothetical protein
LASTIVIISVIGSIAEDPEAVVLVKGTRAMEGQTGGRPVINYKTQKKSCHEFR